jgi:N-acetylglucosamine-6-phosphate deacetylase
MAPASTNSLLLRGARIIDHDRMIEPGAVLIESGHIVRIFDSETPQLPAADMVVDLDGSTLFPGFIDLHIHGAAGFDTMEAGEDGLGRVAAFLADNGVTAWLPTLVPAPKEQYEHAIDAIEQAVAQTLVCDNPGDHRLKSVPLVSV